MIGPGFSASRTALLSLNGSSRAHSRPWFASPTAVRTCPRPGRRAAWALLWAAGCALAPPAGAQDCPSGQPADAFYEACLTPAAIADDGDSLDTWQGYVSSDAAATDPQLNAAGVLDSAEFAVDGTTYTIGVLAANHSSTPSTTVVSFGREVPAGWVLQIGTAPRDIHKYPYLFPVADAVFHASYRPDDGSGIANLFAVPNAYVWDVPSDGTQPPISFPNNRPVKGGKLSVSLWRPHPFVFAPARVDVDEGSTADYTVALASQPNADVTVAIASSDADAATVSPESLDFTTTNWNTAQTVTVTGVADADSNHESVRLVHTTPEYAAGVVVATVDDDEDTAATAFDADSGLVPDGLTEGGRFRLLLVTSTTRDATPTAIGDYDTFVRTAVAGGHADIQAHSAAFEVLGCTSAVDARDHTDTTSSDTAAPIYWLGGAKVADDYADLYDGTWDSNEPRDQEGSVPSNANPLVFTGCSADGTKQNHLGGNAGQADQGRPATNGEEIDGSGNADRTASRRLYGLSPVFEVAPAADRLVSNKAEADDEVNSGSQSVYQAFTTGQNPGGYALTSVEVKVSRDEQTAIALTLHRAQSNGRPNTTPAATLGSISYADTPATADWRTVAPAAPVELAADTTYFVRLATEVSGRNFSTRVTNSDSERGATGWSIADGVVLRFGAVWVDAPGAILLAVNGAPTFDTTAPAVDSATVNGTTLVITFDEDLAAAANLANGAFTVKRTRGGSEATVSLAGTPSIGGATVTLTLGDALLSTDTDVKVSYAKPGAGTDNTLKDASGNEVANFTDEPATNETPNRAPTLDNTIPDQTATVDAAFSYTFPANTFSDPDGHPLTYTATGMPSWLSFTAATRTFAGTPRAGDEGTTNVTVTADDGNGGTVSDTFAVTVSARRNNPPTVAIPIPNRTATVDAAFSYTFPANTFSDPDAHPLTYTATGMPSWLSFTAATRTFAGTPRAGDEGTTNVTVTADDGNGGTVSDTFAVTVSARRNNPPTVANPIPDRSAKVDEAFSYTFPANTFSDPDGHSLTYTAGMPSWLSFTAATRTFAGTPRAGDEGTTNVTVTADDGNGGTVSDTFAVTVSAGPNRPPTVANRIPNQTATEGSRFDYAFPANTFADLDNDPLTYAAAGMPPWLSFAPAARRFSGTPREGDDGATDVTVTADDRRGGTVSDTFRITVSAANEVPTVAHPIPDQRAPVDEPFDYTFPANTFHDPEGDRLTYTAGGMPSWLSFTASSRRFFGTPTATDAGTSQVTVTASDGNGNAMTLPFSIEVAENWAPTVRRPIPDQRATVGARFEYAFPADTFDDFDGDALTYAATRDDGAALPAWLSFADATRTFSGDPAAGDAATLHVRVTADDGNGGTASDVFRMVVSPETAGTCASPSGATCRTTGCRRVKQWPPSVGGCPDRPDPSVYADCDLRAQGAEFLQGGCPDYAKTGETSNAWCHDFAEAKMWACPVDGGPVGWTATGITAVSGGYGLRWTNDTASASVSGALLTLTWPTPRDAFAAPRGSDFAVRADGAPLAVVAAALSGDAALLALSPPALPGQAVLVDYLGSAMHPLRGADGTEAAPWRDLAAANLTEPDGGVGTVDPLAAAKALAPGVRPPPAWLLDEGGRPPPGLADLSLAGAGLGDAAVAPLARAAQLRRLDLSGNALADLSALGGLAALESLDLSDNDVADLWPLAGLAGLRRLDVSGNRVEDLSPLAGLPNLEVLVVDANLVADAGALTHLARLENLGLADNAVADLAPLADLASLRRLDLGGNPARDASPLGDLGTLVWLRLPETAEAPAERLVRLRWLWSGDGGGCVGCGPARAAERDR